MTKAKLLFVLVLTAALVATVVWFLHPNTTQTARYVTSQACRSCHPENYSEWAKTLHHVMFRPVTDDEFVLGDFSQEDPALTFSREDVEYVVGNRWEQVYARKIDGEFYPFTARWYVKQQEWAPYKVDSWHETPMSQKCNGCHTTGFNPETFEFTEFGIGCEACHGPGSRHMMNKKRGVSLECRPCHRPLPTERMDIVRTVSSTVCGQCHSRGKSVAYSDQEEGTFDFPVGYVPGEDLAKSFNPVTPATNTKNKYWWGNGVAKARHQEFADWEMSSHSQTLRLMQEKASTDRGGVSDDCLECHSTDFHLAEESSRPTLESAQYGITCVGCHDPHSVGSGEDLSAADRDKPCASCHGAASSSCPEQMARCDIPCPDDQVSCVDCHMPYVVKSGGWFSIRGHAFKINFPEEGEPYVTPNSCQNGNCHMERSAEWVRNRFTEFYSP